MTTFATLPGLPEPAPKGTRNRCPNCGAPVRHIWDGDMVAIRWTASQHPTPRPVALAAAATLGRTILIRLDGKQHQRWRRLNRWNMASTYLATGHHHLNHQCGHDPPPTQTVRQPLPDTPPF